MALITVRNTETGEVLQLDEGWLERFPEDPFEPLSDEELGKLPAAPYGVIELPTTSDEAAPTTPAEQPKKATAEQPADEPAPRGRF